MNIDFIDEYGFELLSTIIEIKKKKKFGKEYININLYDEISKDFLVEFDNNCLLLNIYKDGMILKNYLKDIEKLVNSGNYNSYEMFKLYEEYIGVVQVQRQIMKKTKSKIHMQCLNYLDELLLEIYKFIDKFFESYGF